MGLFRLLSPVVARRNTRAKEVGSYACIHVRPDVFNGARRYIFPPIYATSIGTKQRRCSFSFTLTLKYRLGRTAIGCGSHFEASCCKRYATD